MSEPAGLDRTLTPFGAVPINEEISPTDGILVDGDMSHYFAVGRSALHCIRVSMLAAGVKTFANILDLPSGYGRVLRHLQAAFRDAHLTARDIDRDEVDVCAATFGATPVYGDESPGKIDLQGDYDLIWMGSLSPIWTQGDAKPSSSFSALIFGATGSSLLRYTAGQSWIQ